MNAPAKELVKTKTAEAIFTYSLQMAALVRQ